MKFGLFVIQKMASVFRKSSNRDVLLARPWQHINGAIS